MKIILKLIIALLLPAALCLPVFAQDEEGAAPPAGTTTESDVRPMVKPAARPAAKPAAKKAAPKKKPAKKKKKPAKPVSEYKFTSADAVPAYKFDKKANPIVKKVPPKKKGAAKPAAKKTDGDDSKYIKEESATKSPEEGQ